MRVLILHNAVREDAPPHERDVLVQVDEVAVALQHLGYSWEVCACTLDLERVEQKLVSYDPDVAFNLVESLGGRDRLIHLVPSLLEALKVPFTGCGTECLLASGNKLVAKRRFEAAGLSTPEVVRAHGAGIGTPCRQAAPWPVIVKSVWEHGSLGLEEDSILEGGVDLEPELARLAPRYGGSCFAERFIPGREINVALLQRPEGVQVLPPSEIVFEGPQQLRPRIVGYRAKWKEDSAEALQTPRRLEFSGADRRLLGQLQTIARAAWHALRARGWARVDFRIDNRGTPYVLELNANPCLSPDAGFRASLDEAGVAFETAVDLLIRSALGARAGTRLGAAVG